MELLSRLLRVGIIPPVTLRVPEKGLREGLGILMRS